MTVKTGELFVTVVNSGDTDAFLDLFVPSGFVNDWGRTFNGRAGIKGWSDDEFIGAQGQLTEVHITATAKTTDVVALWTSQRYTGPSRFVLHQAGDKLASMAITAA